MVADTVAVVISTVPVIFASCFWLLAFKAIKETPRVVTVFVTVTILEEVPARNTSGTVNPGLFPVERAVSAVPLTLIVVALLITNFIPRLFFTLGVRTHGTTWFSCLVVAESSREVQRTKAGMLKWV